MYTLPHLRKTCVSPLSQNGAPIAIGKQQNTASFHLAQLDSKLIYALPASAIAFGALQCPHDFFQNQEGAQSSMHKHRAQKSFITQAYFKIAWSRSDAELH